MRTVQYQWPGAYNCCTCGMVQMLAAGVVSAALDKMHIAGG